MALRPAGLLAAILLCIGSFATAEAADESALELLQSGARVRVKLKDARATGLAPLVRDGWITGSFVDWQRDTLSIEPWDASGRLSIATRVAREFQVSNGVHGRESTGAEIGALTGMAMGVGFILIVCSDGYCGEAEGNSDYTVFLAIVFGLGGGLVGGGVGALVGSFIHKEEWKQVPLDGVRLSGWSPGSDGAGLAIHFSFDAGP